MDVLKAIKTRWSCRNYLQKPVEFDKLTVILEAGRFSPSAGNLQDWKFVLITDFGLRKGIAQHCMEQYWMESAPAMIVVCSDHAKTESHYGLRGKRLYSVQSSAAAVENMLLAAVGLGLGACWVGAFDEEFISSKLNLPDDVRPQAIITVGYPADKLPIEKDRTSLQSLMSFNSYGNRVDKVHLVLDDYSVEWEKQAEKLKPDFKKGVSKLKSHVNKLKDKLKEQHKQLRDSQDKS